MSGKTIGKWQVIKEIGRGGNGIVFLVAHKEKNYALKTLSHFGKQKPYARFRDEIKALQNLTEVDGIIKLIDYSLPEKPSNINPPFYVMPLGTPLLDYVKNKSPEVVFDFFIEIASTLEILHAAEYTHRDIKPDNIIIIDDKPKLSDFGLVSFPDKQDLTKKDEKLGPAKTIAPEMKWNSSTAEFKKADVYSLAKTLWIAVTGNKNGFEGQYSKNSSLAIKNYVTLVVNQNTVIGKWYYHTLVLLDHLLIRATDNNPELRPSTIEFKEQLLNWHESNKNFFKGNPIDWKEIIDELFPHAIPTKCEWEEPHLITKVLQFFTNYNNLNYCFLPFSGGNSLDTVQLASKNIVINNNTILEPEKLIFYNPGAYEWCYFRLIVKDSIPYTKAETKQFEQYKCDENYNFIGEADFDEGGPHLLRYLHGSFIIIQRTSPINSLPGKYKDFWIDGHSGLHDKIPCSEYNSVITAFCKANQKGEYL